MSSDEWKSVRLGDLVSINSTSISTSYQYDVIEYIDTSSVTRNEFLPPQTMNLSDAPSRARRIVNHGDTILSTVRPIQRHFGFIRNPKPNTVVSTGFAVLTPKSINAEFLYYYLSQEPITNYLNSIAETSTTTFPAFRPEILSELEIEIPKDQATQSRIAGIFSTLDDKIELNRQTNATLEAIAQAIFKEWFVDFNYPGATGELVESELGPIPKGWRLSSLTSELNIVYGRNLPTTKLTAEGFPVFGGNGLLGFYKDYLYDEPQIIVSCRGAASGKVNQSLPKSFVTNNSLVFEIPKTSTITFPYLKFFCLNMDFRSFVSGSAQPQLTIDSLHQAKLLVPDSISVTRLGVIFHSNYFTGCINNRNN